MKHNEYFQQDALSVTVPVKDHYLINEALLDYHNKRYLQMTRLIIAYGPWEFFKDLDLIFDRCEWRERGNKYHLFAQMTIRFFEYKLQAGQDE